MLTPVFYSFILEQFEVSFHFTPFNTVFLDAIVALNLPIADFSVGDLLRFSTIMELLWIALPLTLCFITLIAGQWQKLYEQAPHFFVSTLNVGITGRPGFDFIILLLLILLLIGIGYFVNKWYYKVEKRRRVFLPIKNPQNELETFINCIGWEHKLPFFFKCQYEYSLYFLELQINSNILKKDLPYTWLEGWAEVLMGAKDLKGIDDTNRYFLEQSKFFSLQAEKLEKVNVELLKSEDIY
jgi:hypothetical protein